MRITLFLLAAAAVLLFGCDSRDIMDRPIIADNFEEFMLEINDVCKKTDKETCDAIKGPVALGLPDAANADYKPSGEDVFTAEEIFRKLNGKTPSELIRIYKGMLLKNLETVRKRDLDIKKNLDLLLDSYESTKKYATDIIVSDIELISDKNLRKMRLGFTVSNETEFVLKQLAAEAEFYSASDILLGRTKAFVCELAPNLKPKGRVIIKTLLNSVPENDLALIRAAKNLKIKVTVSSVQTGSKNENEQNLILSLPYSYHRMRELLSESELLYNDTVKKINAIDAKRRS